MVLFIHNVKKIKDAAHKNGVKTLSVDKASPFKPTLFKVLFTCSTIPLNSLKFVIFQFKYYYLNAKQ